MALTRCMVTAFRSLALPVLLLGLCVIPLPLGMFAQTTSTTQQDTAILSGSVVDAAAKPVSGAHVFVESQVAKVPVQVMADTFGSFLFRAPQPGSYTIYAALGAVESKRSTVVLTQNSRHEIRIVLDVVTQSADGIDFVDKPDFTVAGVTDWTAVGGHGSDATLRTSEELNRETRALQAQPSPASAPDSATASAERMMELRLLAAVSASPQGYESNRDLGLFYLTAGRFQQAVPLLEAASRIRGGSAEDEYHLAQGLQGTGNFAAALTQVRRALAQHDSGDFHRLAGELEESMGDPLGAVREEQRATQLDPSETNYFTWGSELLLHRAIWQAAEVFATGAKAYPASARMKTAWGAALFSGALYDQAAQKLCEASDLDPSAREAYLFAGSIALASPAMASCLPPMLERFLRLQPNDAEANYFNAMILLKQGGATDRAYQLLLKAVALDPRCSDAYLQLGILSSGHKDYAGAIGYYAKALEADPRQGEAHYRLGVAYDRTGDAAKARVEYQLHEQIDTENAARVEQQRREVKQFSILTNNPSATTATP